jgi:hypothetical protein
MTDRYSVSQISSRSKSQITQPKKLISIIELCSFYEGKFLLLAIWKPSQMGLAEFEKIFDAPELTE